MEQKIEAISKERPGWSDAEERRLRMKSLRFLGKAKLRFED